MIVAHRGYSALYPENTMAAFHAAVDWELSMIEMDLHMTMDNHIVVVHDHDLGRTINGEGLIHETPWSELRDLDAGSWFSQEFSGERIPELPDVLQGIPLHIQLNLEIKHEGFEGQPDRLQKFFDQFLRQIRGQESRILVSCFSLEILQALRSRSPGLRLGFLDDHPAGGIPWEVLKPVALYSYHLNFRELTSKMAEEIHGHGLKLFVYTPNREADLCQMLSLGVDALITDEVELAKGILAR